MGQQGGKIGGSFETEFEKVRRHRLKNRTEKTWNKGLFRQNQPLKESYGTSVILLAEGHEIDERDIQYDATALQWAAEYGHEGIVEILISNGAELNALNNQGRTALHWATLNSKLETCKVLIKKWAKLNIRDEKGETPIDFAMSNGSSLGSTTARKPKRRQADYPVV